MDKNKVVTISNPQSPYFKEKGKVLEFLPQEQVEIFLFKSEIIVAVKLNDIAQTNKVFQPKSRKDFYTYIQDSKTSRVDIVNCTKKMIEGKVISLSEGFSESDLISLLENEELDKTQIVDEFRNLRDSNKLEFNLVNNTQPFIKKDFKKRNNQN